ncbi:uncharacterized protein LOC121593112 isoform X7 [Anopheles merus]|uniref:uncharacterized protein LOC121593112 isoform X7 n=1 Tax=Anopheles merus TaxID=30066 RepID=UPI001BE4C199|nr:uncharacterized protein LOC121593112 isoform X7 [Anopheles merus]
MGVMLSVLVAGVGAMDLIYCLAYMSGSEQPSNAIEDVPDKQQHEQQHEQQQPDAKVEQLEQYKETVRQQIKAAPPRSTVEGVTYAQDGVPYKDGYRLEPSVEGAAQLDVLIEKLRILERQSQEKEQQLEQMSVQMSELERSTAEQSLIIEELRSRSTSRAHSVEPLGAYRNNLSPADAVPQIVLNEPHDSGGGGADEPRPSSSKFRPIRRDDGLRRSVKRRSVTSVTSLEDRTDELERLSQLEDEECARMDDYIPIVYSRDDLQDPMNRRHNISPIPESCHHHEDDERQWVPERSPEPTLAANTTRPWGDIKLDEMKEKAVLRPSRSMSIEEEELEPPAAAVAVAQQLHVSESAPSNLSSHSNSPDREERRGSGRVEPMLRRTTKEADLTSLLLEQQQQQQGGGGASQSQSPAVPPSPPQHHTTAAPLRPSLTVPVVPSRTPSVSPLPLDASPEELVFEIGHLDGLIFEAKSREPTPSRAPSRNEPLLRPDELAFDIGNMGGLILGPPSRSVSPALPTPHPSIESSGGGGASLSPLSWESAAGSAAAHNEHTKQPQ